MCELALCATASTYSTIFLQLVAVAATAPPLKKKQSYEM